MRKREGRYPKANAPNGFYRFLPRLPPRLRPRRISAVSVLNRASMVVRFLLSPTDPNWSWDYRYLVRLSSRQNKKGPPVPVRERWPLQYPVDCWLAYGDGSTEGANVSSPLSTRWDHSTVPSGAPSQKLMVREPVRWERTISAITHTMSAAGYCNDSMRILWATDRGGVAPTSIYFLLSRMIGRPSDFWSTDGG